MRLPEAVTSGFILWGVVLGGHYHQSVEEVLSFFAVGVVWLIILHILREKGS